MQPAHSSRPQLLAAGTSKFQRLLLPGLALCAASGGFAATKLAVLTLEVELAEQAAADLDAAAAAAATAHSAAIADYSEAVAAYVAGILQEQSAAAAAAAMDTVAASASGSGSGQEVSSCAGPTAASGADAIDRQVLCLLPGWLHWSP